MPVSAYQSLLNELKGLYPVVASLENYQISQGNLTNVKEYRILHYNHTSNLVNLRLFYQLEGRFVVLVEEYDEISAFKPYKKTYANLAEIQSAIANNSALGYALDFATKKPILTNTSILFAVEWANDPKIIIYRFYAENSTHTF